MKIWYTTDIYHISKKWFDIASNQNKLNTEMYSRVLRMWRYLKNIYKILIDILKFLKIAYTAYKIWELAYTAYKIWVGLTTASKICVLICVLFAGSTVTIPLLIKDDKTELEDQKKKSDIEIVVEKSDTSKNVVTTKTQKSTVKGKSRKFKMQDIKPNSKTKNSIDKQAEIQKIQSQMKVEIEAQIKANNETNEEADKAISKAKTDLKELQERVNRLSVGK